MARRRFNFPWRAPARESGPVRLGSRRLYILPTRFGLVYVALLLGLLLASMNYAISLGYLFTFLLGGVGVVTMFQTQRNLFGLTLRGLAVAPVYAGESSRLRLQIENPDARLRGALSWTLSSGPGVEDDLPGKSTLELTINLPQPRRGLHPLGRLTLASTWPLGLFRCWSVFELDWAALVYPKPAADVRPLPEPSGAGRGGRATRDGNDEFAGLRDYRPGDSPRRIAWKSAARGGLPLTKQFVGEAGGELWLDWQATPEQEVEARLSRLTRWALDAEHAGLDWGVRLPGGEIPPGRGDQHLKAALERLARHGET